MPADSHLDALLQHRALQTTHHERLTTAAQERSRSIRTTFQQTRDVCAEVRRLQEDLRDVKEETTQLDQRLRSQYQLRLSMLTALSAKSNDEATRIKEALDSAAMGWAGVPSRVVKIIADMDELEALHARLQEVGVSIKDAAAESLHAQSLHNAATLTSAADAVTLQLETKLLPMLLTMENATAVDVETISAALALSRDATSSIHSTLHDLALTTVDRLAQSDHVRQNVEQLGNHILQASHDMQQRAQWIEETKASVQQLKNSHDVHTHMFIPMLEAFAAGSLEIASEARDAVRQAATEVSLLNGTRSFEVQELSAAASALQAQVDAVQAAMHDKESIAAALHVCAEVVQRWCAVRQQEVEMRSTKHSVEKDVSDLTAMNQELTKRLEAVQQLRAAQLMSIQSTLTRLIMDDVPAARTCVESEETTSWQLLEEMQLHEFSLVIQQAALRQELEQQKLQEQQQQQQQERAALAKDALSQRDEPRHRRTVAHKVQLSGVADSTGVILKQAATKNLGPALRRFLPREDSVAMSTWSADESDARGPTVNGGALKPKPQTNAMATPSPMPRQPMRTLPHSSVMQHLAPTGGKRPPTAINTGSTQVQQQSQGVRKVNLRPRQDIPKRPPVNAEDEFDIFAL